MSSSAKWIRSKVFPEVVFTASIPNRLLAEEDGRINLYGGKIYEKSKRMERGTKVIKSWSRLDNAKKHLEIVYGLRQK